MGSDFKFNLIKNLKGSHKYFQELNKPTLRTIIQICAQYFENKCCSEDLLEKGLIKLGNSENDIPEHFHELFAAVLMLIQMFIRLPKGSLKENDLKEFLKELRFQNDCVDDLTKVLLNHRDSLSVQFYEMKSFRSPPQHFSWKINISLMQSEMTNLSKPTIVIHLKTQYGQFKTFQLSILMFHRLRYNIAKLLKEMQILERRQILKN